MHLQQQHIHSPRSHRFTCPAVGPFAVPAFPSSEPLSAEPWDLCFKFWAWQWRSYWQDCPSYCLIALLPFCLFLQKLTACHTGERTITHIGRYSHGRLGKSMHSLCWDAFGRCLFDITKLCAPYMAASFGPMSGIFTFLVQLITFMVAQHPLVFCSLICYLCAKRSWSWRERARSGCQTEPKAMDKGDSPGRSHYSIGCVRTQGKGELRCTVLCLLSSSITINPSMQVFLPSFLLLQLSSLEHLPNLQGWYKSEAQALFLLGVFLLDMDNSHGSFHLLMHGISDFAPACTLLFLSKRFQNQMPYEYELHCLLYATRYSNAALRRMRALNGAFPSRAVGRLDRNCLLCLSRRVKKVRETGMHQNQEANDPIQGLSTCQGSRADAPPSLGRSSTTWTWIPTWTWTEDGQWTVPRTSADALCICTVSFSFIFFSLFFFASLPFACLTIPVHESALALKSGSPCRWPPFFPSVRSFQILQAGLEHSVLFSVTGGQKGSKPRVWPSLAFLWPCLLLDFYDHFLLAAWDQVSQSGKQGRFAWTRTSFSGLFAPLSPSPIASYRFLHACAYSLSLGARMTPPRISYLS